MITSLNEKQQGLLETYKKKWLYIGLSTKPIDFDKAKTSVTATYTSVGLEAPNIIYAASPAAAYKILIEEYKINKSEITNSIIYGNNEAPWLSFYNYFQEVVGLDCCDKLNTIFEIADNCGWVFVFDELAVICDRPVSILFDDNKLLHCDFAPAVEYKDGFSTYSWHGVRIPAEWIENKNSITPEIALTWSNIEQRRCACEIIGLDSSQE